MVVTVTNVERVSSEDASRARYLVQYVRNGVREFAELDFVSGEIPYLTVNVMDRDVELEVGPLITRVVYLRHSDVEVTFPLELESSMHFDPEQNRFVRSSDE